MSSSTSLVVWNQDNLALSGYTRRKRAYLEASLTKVFLQHAWDSMCSFIGIAKASFSTRWNHIPLPGVEAKLYLSALPVRNAITGYNDADTLTQPGGPEIKSVLCMTEGFENTNGSLFRPITPNDWKNRDVTFLQLETVDLQGLDHGHIASAIYFIGQQLIVQKKNTLVHCKAGVGRSAGVVACFMMKQFPVQYPTLDLAIEHLKKHRYQVKLEPQKIQDINEYFSYLRLAETLDI